MTSPDYAYESSQSSILRPYYQRYLWRFILDALPEWLSPNAMTVISTLCCALSCLLAAFFRESSFALAIAAVLVLSYLTLDNLDGAHARRLGCSSRLGEFLDHWLDTLNNGFVVLGACLAGGLPPLLTLCVLSVGSMAFFAVQWELEHTGVFRMGRVADIEGNTTVAGLYLLLAVFGCDFLLLAPVPGLPSLAVWMGCGVMAQAVWTLAVAMTRVPGARSEFLAIGFAHLILIAWAVLGGLVPSAYLAIAFFLNPVFTTRPVFWRVLRRSTGALDWVVVVALAAMSAPAILGVSAELGDALGHGCALALGAMTFRHFFFAVGMLRQEARAEAIEAIP